MTNMACSHNIFELALLGVLHRLCKLLCLIFFPNFALSFGQRFIVVVVFSGHLFLRFLLLGKFLPSLEEASQSLEESVLEDEESE